MLPPSTGEPYFEPSDEDVAIGKKTPQPAHRAIARLVRGGYIRVIVTTNFDRLLEQALSEIGIEAYVVSTQADPRRVPPLHTLERCLIVKVHGDRNTPDLRNPLEELAEFCEGMTRLITRIFTDHGFIVCGWVGTVRPRAQGT